MQTQRQGAIRVACSPGIPDSRLWKGSPSVGSPNANASKNCRSCSAPVRRLTGWLYPAFSGKELDRDTSKEDRLMEREFGLVEGGRGNGGLGAARVGGIVVFEVWMGLKSSPPTRKLPSTHGVSIFALKSQPKAAPNTHNYICVTRNLARVAQRTPHSKRHATFLKEHAFLSDERNLNSSYRYQKPHQKPPTSHFSSSHSPLFVRSLPLAAK